MLRLGAAPRRKLLLLPNSKQMVSGRAAPWHPVSPLVASTPEFLFRDSLLYFVGIAEQTEPSASDKIFGRYPPAYPSRSGAALPGCDDRHGTLSSPLEVLRHHGPNRQQRFVTVHTWFACSDICLQEGAIADLSLQGINLCPPGSAAPKGNHARQATVRDSPGHLQLPGLRCCGSFQHRDCRDQRTGASGWRDRAR